MSTQELKPIKEGKVREIYDNGDSLIARPYVIDGMEKTNSLHNYSEFKEIISSINNEKETAVRSKIKTLRNMLKQSEEELSYFKDFYHMDNVLKNDRRVLFDAIEIMDFMRDKIREYQVETGNNYNLEATPAEGTSYRLAKLDKKNTPNIICANEEQYANGADPYYSNSTHLPVTYTDDIFELLDLQDELQTKYTGGTVVHIFGGERISDSETMKNLVRKVCENYRLPYFTFSPTFSVCPNHGYLKGEHQTCPDCHDECEIYSRVVGFYRPVSQWNKGKKSEFGDRKTFSLNKIESACSCHQ